MFRHTMECDDYWNSILMAGGSVLVYDARVSSVSEYPPFASRTRSYLNVTFVEINNLE